jgi:hypothetical protein
VEELLASRVCPKCGEPFRTVEVRAVGGRLYVYAYHGKVGGRAKLCYLGPLWERPTALNSLFASLGWLKDGELLWLADRALSLYFARFSRRPLGERAGAVVELRRLAARALRLAERLSEPP